MVHKISEKDFLKELQKMIEDKTSVHLGEDIFSMTAMCFTKAADEKYFLNKKKQAQLIYACAWLIFVQLFLIFAMYYAFITNESGAYESVFPNNMVLFIVKIPAAIALHLEIYPEIERGLVLMKFANNNPHKFVKDGDVISFILGFAQCFIAVVASWTNI